MPAWLKLMAARPMTIDGGDDFEVNQALQADAADAFGIAVAGDSGDQRSKDEGRDNYGDEAQKNVAEDAQVFAELRTVQADFAAKQHREENPVGQ